MHTEIFDEKIINMQDSFMQGKIEVTTNYFRKLDKELYDNKSECLIPCGYYKKVYIINESYIEFKRRRYRNTKTNQYIYLLDEYLELKKRCKITKYEKIMIQKQIAIDKVSYQNIVNKYNKKLSKGSITKIMQETLFNKLSYYKKNILGPEKYDVIYIDLDDTYTSKARNKKKNNKNNWYRIIHLYQDFDPIAKKFLNEVKLVLTAQISQKPRDKWLFTINKIQEIITKIYGYFPKFKLRFAGDGALNLKAIAYDFNAPYCLDRFHGILNINHVFNNSNLKRKLCIQGKEFDLKELKSGYKNDINEAIKNKDFNKIIKTIDSAIYYFEEFNYKIREINKLRRYLLNNKEHINNWFSGLYYGCFAETFVQQIIKSYFGNVGKRFSNTTLQNMIRFNALVYVM